VNLVGELECEACLLAAVRDGQTVRLERLEE
jgi:hypothetical protein